jgi:cytochrome bd-type quinol oxidase subunit 1
LVTLFMEAIFAGAFLSGIGWARAAHAVAAGVAIAGTLTAGLVALITLRRIPRGLAFALALLSLAIAAALQLVIGAVSAKGANLLWLHVPLGVALVGFAGQVAATARRLGDAP